MPNRRFTSARRKADVNSFKKGAKRVHSFARAAVDGSPETERTVEYAVSLGSTRGAELHAVQVVPPLTWQT